MSQKMMNAWES